jgi:CheY-like chemotaxis protein
MTQKKCLNVLVVDDSELDAMLLGEQIKAGGYELRTRRVDNPEDMAAALADGPWDLVVSDHNMPHFTSSAALEMVRAAHPALPFIVVSGAVDAAFRQAAIQAGANDSVEKGDVPALLDLVARLVPGCADASA